MPKKPERKSRMTLEALDELDRRYKAGENMRGPFSLKTGKPIDIPTGEDPCHDQAC